MDETEIGSMVARLIGDTSNYVTNMKAAADQALSVSAAVETATQKVEAMSSSLTNYANAAKDAFAAVGLGGTLKSSLDMFTSFEAAQTRLAVGARQHGLSVEALTAQYGDFLNMLTRTTTVSYGQGRAALVMAQNMGLFGTAAETAVKQAVGLSTAMGISVEQATRRVAQATAGGGGLGRLASMLPPAIRRISDETQRNAAIQKYLNDQWEQAQAVAGTTGGQLTQLGNLFSSLRFQIGSAVAEAIKPFLSTLKQVVTAIRDMPPNVWRMIGTFMMLATAILSVSGALRILSLLGVSIFSPWLPILALASAAIVTFVDVSGGVGPAWENIKAAVTDAATSAKDAIMGLWEAHKALLIAIGSAATVVGGAILIWKALGVALAVDQFLFVTLGGTILANAVAWVWWAAKVAAATTLVIIFKAAILAMDAVLTLTGSFLAGIVAAIGTLVLGFAGVAAIGAVAWAGVTAAIAAVSAGIGIVKDNSEGLLEAWNNFLTMQSPLRQIGRILGEWGTILRDVAMTAGTSLPKAWELLQAGFALAVEQVKMLFDPLYKYIVEGFEPVWKAVGAGAGAAAKYIAGVFGGEFKMGLTKAYFDFYTELTKGGVLKGLLSNLLPSPATLVDPEPTRKWAEEARGGWGLDELQAKMKKAVDDLNAALKNVKWQDVPDNEAVNQARERVNKIRDQIAQLAKQQGAKQAGQDFRD